MTKAPPITTDEWIRAGLPFEGFLRYSQASDHLRELIETLFDQRFRGEDALQDAQEGGK